MPDFEQVLDGTRVRTCVHLNEGKGEHAKNPDLERIAKSNIF